MISTSQSSVLAQVLKDIATHVGSVWSSSMRFVAMERSMGATAQLGLSVRGKTVGKGEVNGHDAAGHEGAKADFSSKGGIQVPDDGYRVQSKGKVCGRGDS